MYVGIVWGRCYMIVMLGSHKIISIVRGVSIKLIFFICAWIRILVGLESGSGGR